MLILVILLGSFIIITSFWIYFWIKTRMDFRYRILSLCLSYMNSSDLNIVEHDEFARVLSLDFGAYFDRHQHVSLLLMDKHNKKHYFKLIVPRGFTLDIGKEVSVKQHIVYYMSNFKHKICLYEYQGVVETLKDEA